MEETLRLSIGVWVRMIILKKKKKQPASEGESTDAERIENVMQFCARGQRERERERERERVDILIGIGEL